MTQVHQAIITSDAVLMNGCGFSDPYRVRSIVDVLRGGSASVPLRLVLCVRCYTKTEPRFYPLWLNQSVCVCVCWEVRLVFCRWPHGFASCAGVGVSGWGWQ